LNRNFFGYKKIAAKRSASTFKFIEFSFLS
jgi:hypothetical protein